MIYIFLNAVFALFFIGLTVAVDRLSAGSVSSNDPVIVNILLMAIISVIYTLVIQGFMPPVLSLLLLRLVMALEGVFLTNISMCFVFYGRKKGGASVVAAKVFFYILAVFIAFTKIRSIGASAEAGLVVSSKMIFSGEAAREAPILWHQAFNAIYKFLLPGLCCLFMLLINERKGSRFDKYKGYVDLFALILMWVSMAIVAAVSRYISSFSLLFPVSFTFLLMVMVMSSSAKAAMSGRDMAALLGRAALSCLFPAAIIGAVFAAAFGLSLSNLPLFAAILAAAVVVMFFLIQKAAKFFTGSRMMRSGDWSAALESDLSRMDYNSGDMDAIARGMFEIFKKNVECSSMKVFINDGKGSMGTAYASDGSSLALSAGDSAFDELLNINKVVVILDELDTSHELDDARAGLSKIFADTASDALFLLNEGRNILGVITLGVKASGDHYKAYDEEVFQKLYSHFFVFGYFMRNIANKDVIGIVNRELRMASQIITSIQENTDAVKSPKLDAGYVMVAARNIGGEFIDLIRLTDTSHLFVVGSLSGRGIAASMNMVILKSIIRTFLAETRDFKTLVVKVNDFIMRSLQKGSIFSGAFMLVDFKKDTMYYINCGIPAILLYTKSYNNVIEIQGSGHILGFARDVSPFISVKQFKLNPDDIVLACTGGLIDSRSLRGDQFGKERVQQNMLANLMYPAQRMARFQVDALQKFISKEMEYDVSALVLKYQDSQKQSAAE